MPSICLKASARSSKRLKRRASPSGLMASRIRDLMASRIRDLMASRIRDLMASRIRDLMASRIRDLMSSRIRDLMAGLPCRRQAWPHGRDAVTQRLGGGGGEESVSFSFAGSLAAWPFRRDAAAATASCRSEFYEGDSDRLHGRAAGGSPHALTLLVCRSRRPSLFCRL